MHEKYPRVTTVPACDHRKEHGGGTQGVCLRACSASENCFFTWSLQYLLDSSIKPIRPRLKADSNRSARSTVKLSLSQSSILPRDGIPQVGQKTGGGALCRSGAWRLRGQKEGMLLIDTHACSWVGFLSTQPTPSPPFADVPDGTAARRRRRTTADFVMPSPQNR